MIKSAYADRENIKSGSHTPQNFFWAMSWISFSIQQSYMKFDEDHESVNYFYHSSIVKELLVYFRCTSGKKLSFLIF